MKTNSEAKLANTLVRMFSTLSRASSLNCVKDDVVQIDLISGKSILRIDQKTIYQPLTSATTRFLDQPSPLEDQAPNFERLGSLAQALSKHGQNIYFDHIGLCYQVKSKPEERQKLIDESKDTGLNLYEMPSNDVALWLFLGDRSTWKDPLIEFLPVEQTSDVEKDYWLPHVHIDINTPLDGEALEAEIKKAFGETVHILRSCVIDNVVYTIRLRLGVVSGVNIDVDLSTKARGVQYVRQQMLKPLTHN